MAEIQEITDAEFNKLLEEQTPQYKKWSDLEIGKNIYSQRYRCGDYSKRGINGSYFKK